MIVIGKQKEEVWKAGDECNLGHTEFFWFGLVWFWF
jgi:hypothetical protein